MSGTHPEALQLPHENKLSPGDLPSAQPATVTRVTTPLVVPREWYAREGISWTHSQPVCVSIDINGKRDLMKYAAVMQLHPKLGFIARLGQPNAAAKFQNLHLVDVKRRGATDIHISLGDLAWVEANAKAAAPAAAAPPQPQSAARPEDAPAVASSSLASAAGRNVSSANPENEQTSNSTGEAPAPTCAPAEACGQVDASSEAAAPGAANALAAAVTVATGAATSVPPSPTGAASPTELTAAPLAVPAAAGDTAGAALAPAPTPAPMGSRPVLGLCSCRFCPCHFDADPSNAVVDDNKSSTPFSTAVWDHQVALGNRSPGSQGPGSAGPLGLPPRYTPPAAANAGAAAAHTSHLSRERLRNLARGASAPLEAPLGPTGRRGAGSRTTSASGNGAAPAHHAVEVTSGFAAAAAAAAGRLAEEAFIIGTELVLPSELAAPRRNEQHVLVGFEIDGEVEDCQMRYRVQHRDDGSSVVLGVSRPLRGLQLLCLTEKDGDLFIRAATPQLLPATSAPLAVAAGGPAPLARVGSGRQRKPSLKAREGGLEPGAAGLVTATSGGLPPLPPSSGSQAWPAGLPLGQQPLQKKRGSRPPSRASSLDNTYDRHDTCGDKDGAEGMLPFLLPPTAKRPRGSANGRANSSSVVSGSGAVAGGGAAHGGVDQGRGLGGSLSHRHSDDEESPGSTLQRPLAGAAAAAAVQVASMAHAAAGVAATAAQARRGSLVGVDSGLDSGSDGEELTGGLRHGSPTGAGLKRRRSGELGEDLAAGEGQAHPPQVGRRGRAANRAAQRAAAAQQASSGPGGSAASPMDVDGADTGAAAAAGGVRGGRAGGKGRGKRAADSDEDASQGSEGEQAYGTDGEEPSSTNAGSGTPTSTGRGAGSAGAGGRAGSVPRGGQQVAAPAGPRPKSRQRQGSKGKGKPIRHPSRITNVVRNAGAILLMIGRSTMYEKQLRATFGNNPDTSKALRLLEEQGKVVRGGLGYRMHPYHYNLTPVGLEAYEEELRNPGPSYNFAVAMGANIPRVAGAEGAEGGEGGEGEGGAAADGGAAAAGDGGVALPAAGAPAAAAAAVARVVELPAAATAADTPQVLPLPAEQQHGVALLPQRVPDELAASAAAAAAAASSLLLPGMDAAALPAALAAALSACGVNLADPMAQLHMLHQMQAQMHVQQLQRQHAQVQAQMQQAQAQQTQVQPAAELQLVGALPSDAAMLCAAPASGAQGELPCPAADAPGAAPLDPAAAAAVQAQLQAQAALAGVAAGLGVQQQAAPEAVVKVEPQDAVVKVEPKGALTASPTQHLPLVDMAAITACVAPDASAAAAAAGAAPAVDPQVLVLASAVVDAQAAAGADPAAQSYAYVQQQQQITEHSPASCVASASTAAGQAAYGNPYAMYGYPGFPQAVPYPQPLPPGAWPGAPAAVYGQHQMPGAVPLPYQQPAQVAAAPAARFVVRTPCGTGWRAEVPSLDGQQVYTGPPHPTLEGAMQGADMLISKLRPGEPLNRVISPQDAASLAALTPEHVLQVLWAHAAAQQQQQIGSLGGSVAGDPAPRA